MNKKPIKMNQKPKKIQSTKIKQSGQSLQANISQLPNTIYALNQTLSKNNIQQPLLNRLNQQQISSQGIFTSILPLSIQKRTILKMEDIGTMNFNDDEEIELLQKINANTQDNSKPNAKETLKFDLNDKISLDIKLKYKQVQINSSATVTLPLLVTLKVEDIETTEKASKIDLICIIDHSGSMDGKKMELVKDSFTYLLELLGDNDRLSIIIFDHVAERITPLIRMTQVNKKKTLDLLKEVFARGGTDITLGMKYGLEIIKQRRYINNVTSILLLSDGQDKNAQERVKLLLEKYNLKDTFTINTFGFGKDHDPELMSSISQLRDGNFYYIEKLNTVDETFIDCLGGLISVIGEDVNITVKAESSEIFPNIQITKAYGGQEIWKKIDNAYTTGISQLFSGIRKDYVLEIQIPKTDKELDDVTRNIKIASVTCSIKSLKDSGNNDITKSKVLVPVFLNEIEEIKENEEDGDVMFNYYKVLGAEIMKEAKNLSDKNKFDEAKKILQNFKEDISNSKFKKDKNIQDLIKDLDIAINNVRPEIYQDSGRNYMIQNVQATIHQKSNLTSNIQSRNSVQVKLVTTQKNSKMKYIF